MTNSTLAATNWALTNRAHLNAICGALESYFQAMDTGNRFEQTITYNYLNDKFLQAREHLAKGIWEEGEES